MSSKSISNELNTNNNILKKKRVRKNSITKDAHSENTFFSAKSKKSFPSKKDEKLKGKREFEDVLLKKALLQKPILKVNCFVCSKDISNLIRVIGISLNEYCIDCLFKLKVNENYHLVDKLDFPIFNSEWTFKEELQLLACIEKFGLDNWNEISNSIKSKPKLPCESHYYTYNLKSITNPIQSVDDIIFKGFVNNGFYLNIEKNHENQKKEEELKAKIIQKQGIIPENITSKDQIKNNRSRSLVKNRNRKDQKNISTAEEIIGYWPRREEFDIEFLNEAEIEIAELEFLEDDSQEDIDLKLNVLQIYNYHLAEREARKKFVIERGLLDVKKQMNFERKLPKDDREIYICLKPFARFLSQDEFNELFEGLVLEKNLRQRLNQLKAYEDLGLKTYEDIEKYLEMDNYKKVKEKNNIVDNIANQKQDKENALELQVNEKEFIKKKNFQEELYIEIKQRINKESKNTIKTALSQKYSISKDDIDQIAEFLVKLKK